MGDFGISIFLSTLLLLAAKADKKQLEVRKGNEKFGLDMFKLLCGESNGNVLFSPFSAHAVLSMVYAGAGGSTKEAFAKTLYAPDPVTAAEGYESVFNDLNNEGNDVTVSVANKIFVNYDKELQPQFSDVCKSKFLSDVGSINFQDAENAATEINSWVEGKTSNKIQNLFKPDDITLDTQIVLVNALYFKGEWLRPFGKEETENESFHISDEEKVEVPMMYSTGTYYYKKDTELGMELVQIPFKNGNFSMIIFLPFEKNGLEDMLARLLTTEKEKVVQGIKQTFMDLSLPKFKISQTIDMEDNLKKLGLGEIFDPANCDLTNMFNGGRQMYITKAIQKAYIDVNEDGCEAAVASGMIGSARQLPQESFKADHPFLVTILHQSSDYQDILFSGRVVNPTVEE